MKMKVSTIPAGYQYGEEFDETDSGFLKWVWCRLRCVNGDRSDASWMLRLQRYIRDIEVKEIQVEREKSPEHHSNQPKPDELRCKQIVETMCRCVEEDMPIPKSWVQELRERTSNV